MNRAALSPDGLGTVPTLVLGAKVYQVDLERMAVHVEDGRTFEGDLIVAADGIRSDAGTSVFGRLPTVKTGFSAYRCMVPSKRLRDDPDTAPLLKCAKVLMIVHPERRIVIYPCSSWDTMNFVCIFPDGRDRRQQWNKGASTEEMVETFGDFHPVVVKMLSMAEDTGVWQLRGRDPLSTLVKGHFCLIGDAAHAMGPHQGQGACQAIEGAEALRVVLKGAELSDIEERLLIYDELRVERVRRVIENTRKMGPKRVGDGPRMSDREYSQYSVAFSDYHWSYSMTPEAIRLMNQPGIKMECADAATGQLVVLEGNDLGNGSLN
ncbi:FAD/NAD(P)-binding domain-containing protein [Fusarium keratoplasticum]|nr:FAD/NAD(P)-binding domain-containing protein [Fusarium keratoplasticum]